MEEPHDVADRLCCLSVCRQIREAEWANSRAELSQVRDRPTYFKNTCTKQAPSEPWDPGWKTTKPLYGCCRVCVWECDDKQGFSISFRCHMMQIKRHLAMNVPRLECLPLTRGTTGKNMLVVSGAAHTHTHTHRLSQIHTLTLYLWWFKPCPSVGVKRGYLRQMSSEKQGCLKSRPQKECTPAWIPHGPKALWG